MASNTMEQQPDPLVGRVIAGKLELTELLGSGAMGKVYRAHHRGLDKTVAIKVLHRTEIVNQELVRRFQAEARAASRLDHPNSLRILDFGEDGPDQLLYIAMEFLDGEDLSDVLQREKRLDGARAAEIMVQVCAALAVAHQEGVVHRDMKPGNIMLIARWDENGARHDMVKVCDFGLAKILDVPPEDATGAPLTKAGMIMGTPSYMSPEQASGVPLDGASDIYSCGVILYQMLTGRTPFQAETMAGVLIKHITEEPTPILQIAPDADPKLAEIAHRALMKDKEARFPSARDMMIAIRGAMRSERADQPWMPRVPSSVGPQIDAAPKPPSIAKVSPLVEPAATVTRSQTLAPPDTGRKGVMFAAIAGSLALLGAGAAIALVVVRDRERAAQPAVVAQAPAPAPGAATVAKIDPPAPAPVAVAEPEAKPQKSAREVFTKTPRAQPARKVVPPREPEAMMKEEPPPPEPTPAPAPMKEEPPPPEPPPPAPAPVVKEEPPPGPKKLGASFDLQSTIAALDIVSGAVSKNRSRDALQIGVGAASTCLRTPIARAGTETQGEVRIKARIEHTGKLRNITTQSALPNIESCIAEAFAPARMPRPDTGDAEISFTLRYTAR